MPGETGARHHAVAVACARIEPGGGRRSGGSRDPPRSRGSWRRTRRSPRQDFATAPRARRRRPRDRSHRRPRRPAPHARCARHRRASTRRCLAVRAPASSVRSPLRSSGRSGPCAWPAWSHDRADRELSSRAARLIASGRPRPDHRGRGAARRSCSTSSRNAAYGSHRCLGILEVHVMTGTGDRHVARAQPSDPLGLLLRREVAPRVVLGSGDRRAPGTAHGAAPRPGARR